MTQIEAAAVLDTLTVAYPTFYARQGSAEKLRAVQLWATMFADYPVQVVLAAVQAFIATDERGFPPAIGQIMGKIRSVTEREELTELAAWTMVKRALRNGLYGYREEWAKLPPEVQSAVHAPEVLKEWATISEDELDTVVASNFQRTFRTVSNRRRELQAIPPAAMAVLSGVAEHLALDKHLALEEG